MSTVVIIPARYASTRLPGKCLLAQTGKSLIQHVVESVSPARGIDQVVVATDDDRIKQAVEAFQGRAVMTADTHTSGSDRLAEAADILGLADDDVVINVQGDEPDMPPACVENLAELLKSRDVPMATLATPISAELAADPNRVKVVLAQDGRAMYFSRSPIPFDRDRSGSSDYLQHLGIYAYRVEFLKHFTRLDPTPAEQIEKLEQLRALEHGYDILVAEVDYHGTGIDTPEDYARFVARSRGDRS